VTLATEALFLTPTVACRIGIIKGHDVEDLRSEKLKANDSVLSPTIDDDAAFGS
jgi:hypothetical protein